MPKRSSEVGPADSGQAENNRGMGPLSPKTLNNETEVLPPASPMRHPIRRVLRLFTRRSRVEALGIFILMLVGAGLEAVGVGAMLPFVGVINDPTIIETNVFLGWLYEFLPVASHAEFLLWLSAALLIFFTVKTLLMTAVFYLQYRFALTGYAEVARRLLASYLHQPYTFHLQRNSSDLLRRVTQDTYHFFIGVVLPVFYLAVEGLVILMLLVLLIILQPLPAIIAALTLATAGLVYQLFISKKAAALGREHQIHYAGVLKWVNQSLHGIKETKVLGREEFFIRTTTEKTKQFARAVQYLNTMTQVPRLGIEWLTVIVMLAIISTMILRGDPVQAAVPTLAVFGLAAVRMLPSLNRIISALTSIRYYLPTLDSIDGEMVAAGAKLPAPCSESVSRLEVSTAIEFCGISYSYPGSDRAAIHDLNLRIERGSSIALVGESGAGKTTIVDLMLGLLTPEHGEIRVDGVDITHRTNQWQRIIGYIPQPVYLTDDTIRRNVAFGLPDDQIDDRQVLRSLDLAQLGALVDELPSGLDTIVGERGIRFSAGQRQRIGIARAVYHKPSVLVLDEATSALDNHTELQIGRAVNELRGDKTIVIIAHRLSTVRQCDAIHVIRDGTVVASGSYEQLLAESTEFQRLARTTEAEDGSSPEEGVVPAQSSKDHFPVQS